MVIFVYIYCAQRITIMKIQEVRCKKKCVICKKKLKIFEMNLCSCGKKLCIKHVQRFSHRCTGGKDSVKITKVVAPKVVKI